MLNFGQALHGNISSRFEVRHKPYAHRLVVVRETLVSVSAEALTVTQLSIVPRSVK